MDDTLTTPNDMASPWRGSGADVAVDELSRLRIEVAQLREAMASRAVIEQAKGILMLRYGCDADAAFCGLARWSQNSNVKLRVVADALVTAIVAGTPRPDIEPGLVRWLEERLREGLPAAP